MRKEVSYQTVLVIATITDVNDEPVKNCSLSWSDSRVLTLMMGMYKMFSLTLKTVMLEVQTRLSVLSQGHPIGLNIK